MVAFTEKERAIGEAAATQVCSHTSHEKEWFNSELTHLQYLRNSKNTVSCIKRLIGRKFNNPEVQEELARLPFNAVELPNGDIGVKVMTGGESRTFSITAICAMLIQKLKDTAEKALDR
jgi:molecular chaperone DnaK (HSP70)